MYAWCLLLPRKVSPQREGIQISSNLCWVLEPSPNGYLHKRLQHLELRGHCGRRGRQIVRARWSGTLLSDSFSYQKWGPLRLTNMTAQIWVNQGHQWTCQTARRIAHKVSTLHTNCRQLNKSGSWRGDPSQGKEYQLVAQYQIIGPENMHTSNIIWIHQVIIRNMYPYKSIHMHAITISEKRGYQFERVGRSIWENSEVL
jgi:hypothetical protein